MKEYVAPFGIGLAYPKYAPYIVKFNQVIIRIKEAGLAKKWLDDIILRRKQAKISSGDSQESAVGAVGAVDDPLVRPLTTDNLQGCFILMILGYGVALLAFAVELITKDVLRRCGKW
nr:uncharacterized protein LOC123773087 [Procambarus clarkii]